MRKKAICYLSALSIAFASLAGITGHASAQDRYNYCQQRAAQVTGYYGPSPRGYHGPSALQGAMKGAAFGALVGAIGGKKVKTGKSAKRGAALGALFAGIKKGKSKKRERKARRAYQFELTACMSAGDGS